MEDMTFWEIRIGDIVKAWNYCWVAPGISFSSLMEGSSKAPKNMKVSELVDNNGDWNLVLFRKFLL